MRENLRLYVDAQFASPYAMSAFVGLHEKDLSFEIETVDLGTSQNQLPAYSSMSLTRRVPTLVHGSFSLSESSAITEYLDDAFPAKPLYPADSKSRAKARQVQAWIRSDLMPIRQERNTEVVFYGAKAQPLSAIAQQCADKLGAVRIFVFKALRLFHGGGRRLRRTTDAVGKSVPHLKRQPS